MKFLVFVLILWVVYLGLRTWVNRGGGRHSRGRAWHDNGYLPTDGHAGSSTTRESGSDCRTDSSDNSSSSDCGGGDGGTGVGNKRGGARSALAQSV